MSQFADAWLGWRHFWQQIGPKQGQFLWARDKHLEHKLMTGLILGVDLKCSGNGPKMPARGNYCADRDSKCVWIFWLPKLSRLKIERRSQLWWELKFENSMGLGAWRRQWAAWIGISLALVRHTNCCCGGRPCLTTSTSCLLSFPITQLYFIISITTMPEVEDLELWAFKRKNIEDVKTHKLGKNWEPEDSIIKLHDPKGMRVTTKHRLKDSPHRWRCETKLASAHRENKE